MRRRGRRGRQRDEETQEKQSSCTTEMIFFCTREKDGGGRWEENMKEKCSRESNGGVPLLTRESKK